MRFKIYTCFLLFLVSPAIGQNFEIGAELGYGRTSNLDGVFSISNNKKVNNCLIGLDFNFIPRNLFSVTSKIIYSKNFINSKSIDFVKVPLGIEILLGRKIRCTIGSGFIFSTIINYSKSITDTNFKTNHSDFQFGGFFNTGIKINFASSWNIFIKGQVEFDLIPFYSYDFKYNVNGNEMTEHAYLRTYGLTINAGVTYKLKSKK